MMEESKDPKAWFERKETGRKVTMGLFIVCALFVVTDLVFWILNYDKHPYFKWQEWPAFYAVFGFVDCVFLSLVARYILRSLVMRREDFYEDAQ